MNTKEPKPIQIDADGTKWWLFCFEYDWDGATYGFNIPARSAQEAKDRLNRLPLARFLGQQDGGDIPLRRGGFMVPFIVWCRNLKLGR